jgi:asparagine synthase (glutamine-hydrolysing)
LLFDGMVGKAILREAYAEVLPPEIVHRAKMGFGVPLAQWMRSELRGLVGELLVSDEGPLWPWFQRDAVRSLVRRFLDGDESGRLKVWSLLAFAGWTTERVRS